MRRFLALSLFAALTFAPFAAAQEQGYPPRAAAAMVREWYNRFQDREPDRDGLRHFTFALTQGTSPQMVISEILGSDEFWNNNGRNNEAWVEATFERLLGREPTRREFDYWTWRARHEGRRDVAYALLGRYPRAWQGQAAPEDFGGYGGRRGYYDPYRR